MSVRTAPMNVHCDPNLGVHRHQDQEWPSPGSIPLPTSPRWTCVGLPPEDAPCPWAEWTVNWGLGHPHTDNLRSPSSVDPLVQGKLVTAQKMVQLRRPHCHPSTSLYRVGQRYRRSHPNQVVRITHVCVSTSRLRVAVTGPCPPLIRSTRLGRPTCQK
ncbi:hypothetical protein EDD15DRAFT_1067229 [Pisolithus albus]|nr:hypothetical protein EDD15DRAFT_1067229 [Pisolithus albus]